jgi:hypothetical protein
MTYVEPGTSQMQFYQWTGNGEEFRQQAWRGRYMTEAESVEPSVRAGSMARRTRHHKVTRQF